VGGKKVRKGARKGKATITFSRRGRTLGRRWGVYRNTKRTKNKWTEKSKEVLFWKFKNTQGLN